MFRPTLLSTSVGARDLKPDACFRFFLIPPPVFFLQQTITHYSNKDRGWIVEIIPKFYFCVQFASRARAIDCFAPQASALRINDAR